MKFIYLTGFGLPTGWAHGIQVVNNCEALAALGLEVELVVPRRRNEIEADPFDYYGVEKNFKITKLPCLDLFPGGAGSFYFWLRLVSFLLAARLYLFFKKIDVLYTREPLAGWFFSKLFLELHFLPDFPKKSQVKIWRKVQGLVVLNALMKRELAGLGVAEKNILVAPDGADLKKFGLELSKEEARKKTGLPQDKKIIMYSGSLYLHDWKGVDVLLAAAALLPEDHLLVLVGGEDEEIEKIRGEYQGRNLFLAGRRRHGEVPYYLKAADVFVLPNKKDESISEKYTSPLKLFEYMASGRPIVASGLPSIREILNNDNAILVEAGQPESLAAGIRKAVGDSDLSGKLARQAFADARQYAWDKRVEKIIAFINRTRQSGDK